MNRPEQEIWITVCSTRGPIPLGVAGERIRLAGLDWRIVGVRSTYVTAGIWEVQYILRACGEELARTANGRGSSGEQEADHR